MANIPNRGYPPRQQTRPAAELPPEKEPLPLPRDYVDEAEKVIRRIALERNKITTSKIRNLHSLVSDIYNAENLREDARLLPESVTALTKMRIRVVYEAGRDERSVKPFVNEAKLIEYIKGIGTDRAKLMDFAHYMEALVAYHRFYIGGKEG